MQKVLLKIVTPNGIFFEDKVDVVSVKTNGGGYIALQHGRTPFVASIDISKLIIGSEKANDSRIAAIGGGLVISDEEKVEIITDSITYKEDIDVAKAESNKKELEQLIQNSKDNAEKLKHELELKKAIMQINVRKQ